MVAKAVSYTVNFCRSTKHQSNGCFHVTITPFLTVEIGEHVSGCHCTLDCKTKPYTINTPILCRISSHAMNRHNLAYFGKGPLWDPQSPVLAPSISSLKLNGNDVIKPLAWLVRRVRSKQVTWLNEVDKYRAAGESMLKVLASITTPGSRNSTFIDN